MIRSPLLTIVVFFGGGIVMAHQLPLDVRWIMFAAGMALTLQIALRKYPRILTASILVLYGLLGAILAMSADVVAHDHVSHVARYHRTKPVTIIGWVSSDVEERTTGYARKHQFLVRVKNVLAPWGWEKKSGKVLVQDFGLRPVRYGDVVIFEGKMHRPFHFSEDSRFSYPDFLKRKGITHIISLKRNSTMIIFEGRAGWAVQRWAYRLRAYWRDILDSTLTENEAGVMKAILIGDRTGVPEHVRSLFEKTGTAHILAISGLHVAVVSGLLFVFLKLLPVGRPVQFALVLVGLLFYLMCTGARPSVFRATVMACLIFLGLLIHKEGEVLNSLAAAALILLWINPNHLYDIGFQLSFLCVLAIILTASLWEKWIQRCTGPIRSALAKYLIQGCAVSMAVWLGVAGVVAYYFQIITPVSVLANVVIVPFVSVTVALGFGLLLAGGMSSLWAEAFAACIKVVLNLQVAIVYYLEKIPFAWFELGLIPLWGVFVYYVILGVVYALPLIDKGDEL